MLRIDPIWSRHCGDRQRQLASSWKIEVINYLTGARRGDDTSERSALSHAPFGWKQSRWMNLVGMGFGAKETAGAITGDVAVRLYVRRKVPQARLSPANRIPARVNGIPTDVIAIGTPRFHDRPLKLGAGISHVQGGQGSLGCIVTKPGDDSWYILSACHVLAPAGIAKVGDEINERPGANNAGAAIATLTEFEPLKADGTANTFDAAIARLDDKASVSPTIPKIGVPQSPIVDATLYQSVRKFGAESLATIGVVTDPVFETSVTAAGQPYLFTDIIVVKGAGGPFSRGGDSGAVAVDAMSNRAVGLVIGGGTQGRSFLSPIRPVLQRFGVQLLQ